MEITREQFAQAIEDLAARLEIDAGITHKETIESAKKLKALVLSLPGGEIANSLTAAIVRSCERIEFEGLPFPVQHAARLQAKHSKRELAKLPTREWALAVCAALGHNASETQASGPGGENQADAYVPAQSLPAWRDNFISYKKFKEFLDGTPSIRAERRGQRNMVHAGDWARWLKSKAEGDFANLEKDVTEEIAENIGRSHPQRTSRK